MCDWTAAEHEYVTGDAGYREIAKKYKVADSTVAHYGKRNNWVGKRETYRNETTAKAVQKTAEKNADVLAIQADSAIRIAQAINEYLTDGSHWKPFDLLRIANTWQILQDNLLKQKDMTDTEEQEQKFVAMLPDRTEIDEGR